MVRATREAERLVRSQKPFAQAFTAAGSSVKQMGTRCWLKKTFSRALCCELQALLLKEGEGKGEGKACCGGAGNGGEPDPAFGGPDHARRSPRGWP